MDMDFLKENKVFNLNMRVDMAERIFLEKEAKRMCRITKKKVTVSDIMRGLIHEKMAKKP